MSTPEEPHYPQKRKMDDWLDESTRMFMQAMKVDDRERWGMLVFLNKLITTLSNDRLWMVMKVGVVLALVGFVIGYLSAFQFFVILPSLGGALP